MARAMERQAALLLGRLGLNEPHVWPANGLADCLRICGIVLLSFDVRLHIRRRHQPNGVAKRLEFPRPMMRRGAGFDANQARRHLLKECQHVPALQLAADDNLALSINAVHLTDRLRDIETDCRDHLLLRSVGPLTSPTSMSLTRRWRSRPQHQKQTSLSSSVENRVLTLIGGPVA